MHWQNKFRVTFSAQLNNEEPIEHILDRYHDAHQEQLPELIRPAQRERVHGGRLNVHPAF